MFRSYTKEFKYNLRDKLDVSEIIDILTSEDIENIPLESRMCFRMNFTSGVFTHSESELSGFTCTSSLVMNEKLIPHEALPNTVWEISSSLLVNEYK